jgi:hypothetical protein
VSQVEHSTITIEYREAYNCMRPNILIRSMP